MGKLDQWGTAQRGFGGGGKCKVKGCGEKAAMRIVMVAYPVPDMTPKRILKSKSRTLCANHGMEYYDTMEEKLLS
jgi:hypothetical protein